MKKVLPLVLFVLLAIAGCQRGPATYVITQNPREIAINAEKFANHVEKLSKHYTAEEWDAAFDQFVQMSKNYYEHAGALTNDEQMKYDNARVKFMHAIDANGNEDLARRVKEEYARIMGE
jgi:hypothetical protein